MTALFPRRTNAVARGSLLALGIVVLGLPLVLMAWVRTPLVTGEGDRIVQPIPFDHRIHAYALRIDCEYCHSTVATAASAGVPPTTACVGCHNKALLASTTFAPVRASLSSGKPIVWRRVTALPDFVFFNHSIHIAKGVGCETCHGRIDQMAQVSQATSMSMGWCVGCHRNPAPYLRPRDEITTMGWRADRTSAEHAAAGERFMQEYRVDRKTTCSTCHR
ncbi:MAG: cytochrome c3 family protein [Gemmatimonadaceae bacterium]